ncbi:LCP family protein, partial [Corynebacterium bovis]
RGPRTPHGLRGRGPGRGRADAVGRPRRLVKKRYILAVVLVLILAVPVVMAFRVDGNLQRIDALKDYDGRPADSAGTNWLLVGTDSREGLSEADGARLAAGDITATGARTDSIIVVHVPRFGGKATMLSIPRDSYVDIPGWGKDKINTSFNEGGPALLQQTVEQSTGLRIDHYAEIGFGGFATIVDAVGGIELCPKEPIDDPMAGINLQPGCQTMDGPTALGYVRTRYTSANGDLDRVQRQREFLSAITHKIGSAETVVNPFRSLPLADAFSKALTIDDDDHLWNLGALALALARGANQETVPVAGFEDVDVGNVVVWDDAAAQQLFASLR